MASWGANNYQVHDVIGDSNILDVHPDAVGSHVRMIQYGDNNYMKTVTSGNNNTIRYYGNGGNNNAQVYLYTSGSVVELIQLNGGNTANLTVNGDSIYDYTLLVDQDGNDTHGQAQTPLEVLRPRFGAYFHTWQISLRSQWARKDGPPIYRSVTRLECRGS